MEAQWQTRISNPVEGICYIYDKKEFCDVELWVRETCFKVHKLILAIRSPEFAKILMEPKEKDPEFFKRVTVNENTLTEIGVKILLNFIYKDTITAENKKSLIEAYNAALYYEVKSFQDSCEKEMETWVVTTDDVFGLLDAGHNIPFLKNKCIRFITDHDVEVMESDNFSTASYDSMGIILETGALNNIAASRRIQHVMKWGVNKKTDKSEIDYTSVRELLYNCKPQLLKKLDFHTLSLSELATIAHKYKNLLTSEEIVDFFTYISGDSLSLPEWAQFKEGAKVQGNVTGN